MTYDLNVAVVCVLCIVLVIFGVHAIYASRRERLYRRLLEYAHWDAYTCTSRGVPSATVQYQGLCEACTLLIHRGNVLAGRLEVDNPDLARRVRDCGKALPVFLRDCLLPRAMNTVNDSIYCVSKEWSKVRTDTKLSLDLDTWIDETREWVRVVDDHIATISREMEMEMVAKLGSRDT